MAIQSYKDLIVWRKAMELTRETYSITKQLPKSENYILTSQMLRAAISIASNIAEGYKRKHKAEYLHFLSMSDGSAAELETQLLIAQAEYSDIAYDRAFNLVIEIQKMLYRQMENLRLNPIP